MATSSGPGCPSKLSAPFQVSTLDLGDAWLELARHILDQGRVGSYDALPMREIQLAVITVTRPDPADRVIARWADPERLAWMHANFTDTRRVSALGGADSYATRLLDYERRGHDQLAWVVRRLEDDPSSRSATITTFQPLTDTSYIPCVSMLDFWLCDDTLHLAVYAHSIDFGAKGYANFVELATIQHQVAGRLGVPAGTFTMIVKSAHVYETELDYMRGVLSAQ